MATVLHDHADRFFDGDNFQYVFQGHRLKIQAVRGVVIGGHGFRVAVNHDGFITVFAHGKRSVHAAIIKLDTLADAVWTAAQYHDFFLIAGGGFALFFVAGIHVSGVGRKLGRTGVHAFVNRTHLQGLAIGAHGVLIGIEQAG